MQAPFEPPYRPSDDSPGLALVVLLAALVGLLVVAWLGVHVWHDVVRAAAGAATPATPAAPVVLRA